MARKKVIAFPPKKRKYGAHEKIKEAVKKKLEEQEYEVIDLKTGLKTHEIFRKWFGKEVERDYFGQGKEEGKYPDLIARKGNEIIIIEIKSRKELRRLKEQLENYQKLGKTIFSLHVINTKAKAFSLIFQ